MTGLPAHLREVNGTAQRRCANPDCAGWFYAGSLKRGPGGSFTTSHPETCCPDCTPDEDVEPDLVDIVNGLRHLF